ncbi:PPK2 family polyphosphate kinase [Sphingobacterium rhinopitheci]|uniref:PPK2 family polyphosphate kinase n=1 Tax=Sphingobacterium rhinopitheci TaxID=2781960 RepID=UPI001F51E5F1|nr:PPK2 family polyphosphate kinase [Sphingobacterium rhinopitheci]MCI0919756.1 polyphosphate kinase 2 family protein [Sphingobacterium rhinopitheci]
MLKYQQKLKANSKCKIEDFPSYLDKIDTKDAKEELKNVRKRIAKIQDIMYAHNKYAVLICLQGMDTAGKDSLVREVFKDFNARGVNVSSYKTPSSLELEHDYLWRHYISLPERGKFTVFNRTHYENVLVTRVHPEYLLKENLPGINSVKDIPKDFWKKRYKQIKNFENHLIENGTIVLKFYLNLSKGEQKKRLLRRLEKDEHNWKFSPTDLTERKLWDKYMEYYEDAIQHTSTKKSPWYLIPSDDKDICRYLVAKIILEELEKYKDIQYPELDKDIDNHKKLYKSELEDEK